MSTALTGAFIEIYVVSDYGTTAEAETFLDKTMEDVEMERDPDEIDWIEHGNPNTQRREGQEATTGSLSMVTTDDGQNLRDAGMLDPNTDEVLRNVIHDAVRIYIYENHAEQEAGNHAAVRTYEDAQFVFMTETLPTDGVGEIETELWVHGRTIYGLGEQA